MEPWWPEDSAAPVMWERGWFEQGGAFLRPCRPPADSPHVRECLPGEARLTTRGGSSPTSRPSGHPCLPTAHCKPREAGSIRYRAEMMPLVFPAEFGGRGSDSRLNRFPLQLGLGPAWSCRPGSGIGPVVPCRKLRSGPERVGLGPWNLECRLGWSRLCLCGPVKDIDTGGGPGFPGYPKALPATFREEGGGRGGGRRAEGDGRGDRGSSWMCTEASGGGLAGLRHPDTWSARILGCL